MAAAAHSTNPRAPDCPAELRAETSSGALQSGSKPDAPIRSLSPNEALFRKGDRKAHFYGVETGAICLSHVAGDGHWEVLGFALAGDLVGFGHRDDHVCDATAVFETRVTCFDLGAVDDLERSDPALKEQFNRAFDRELALVRKMLCEAGLQNPVERVAAFLITLSRVNGYEGRDPSVVTDSLRCGVVADWLGMDIQSLSAALGALAKQGLIAYSPPHELRLKDLAGLERLAGGTL